MCRTAASVLFALSLIAAAPPSPPEEWMKLVEQLASEDPDTRQAAAKALEALGERVLPLLRRHGADRSADADVRLRALALAATIVAKGRPQETIFTGHTDGVFRLAVSPDGKRFVSGSWFANREPIARVWDVHSGKELFSLRVPRFGIHCNDWSADGRRIVTGGGDATVRLWDAATGKQLKRLDVSHTVTAVKFLPGGGADHRVVSCDCDGTVSLWDLRKEGARVWSRKAHEGRIYGLAVSPDGKRVLTAGHDSAVLLLEAETGKELRRLEGHKGWVLDVAICPTDGGKQAVSAGHDGTVRLWDLDTGKEVRRFVGHREGVHAVAFSPDGKRLISGGYDRSARVWEVQSGRALEKLEGHKDWVTCVAFLPGDYRLALTGSFDKTSRLWHLLR